MLKSNSYYFIGIGGIGMSSLAHICLDGGAKVSGSDLSESAYTKALEARGADVYFEQNGRLLRKEHVVVFSSAIKEDHPEFKAAKKLGCEMRHRSELLAVLSSMKKPVVIAGTHGKTSSTALMVQAFSEAKKHPSYMVGGKLPGFEHYGALNSGEYFILEGDESDGTLVNYTPHAALITNLELDHIDRFKSLEELKDLFSEFIRKVPSENLVWCADDCHLKTLCTKGISYGFSNHADYQIKNYVQDAWNSKFEIWFNGDLYDKIHLPLIGEHYALNALGVYLISKILEVPIDEVKKGMRTFKGVNRRLDHVGEAYSVTFIDDYAHHPTEVGVTLKAIRNAEPEKRIIALFQPHRHTRFDACFEGFQKQFGDVDQVIITDIFSAGEVKGKYDEDSFVKQLSTPATYCPMQKLVEYLVDFLQPHDVVVTLGAGDVTKIAKLGYEHIKEHGLKNKWKVGFVYGGPSPEHYVSVESAKTFMKEVNTDLYEIEKFYVHPNGSWNDSENDCFSRDEFYRLKSCDVIFPALHGFWGEDGAAQGLFSTLHKPYVGCDYRASTICMDKIATKLLCEKWGIQTTPFIPLEESYWKEDIEGCLQKIEQSFKYPMYVKPSHLGSSIGIYRVESLDALKSSIESAFEFDTHVLIEPEVLGRQLEFALYGSRKVNCFAPGEILSEGGFVEYTGKYGSKALPMEGKAKVETKFLEQGVALAKRVYRLLHVKGYARIDFFFTDDNQYLLNEINPLPGFTPTSMYPLVCEENNFPISKLFDQLLISAFADQRDQQKKVSDIGDAGVIR